MLFTLTQALFDAKREYWQHEQDRVKRIMQDLAFTDDVAAQLAVNRANYATDRQFTNDTAPASSARFWQYWHAPITADDAISTELLVRLPYDSERTDVHGVALANFNNSGAAQLVTFECYCGATVASYCADKALEALEIHAMAEQNAVAALVETDVIEPSPELRRLAAPVCRCTWCGQTHSPPRHKMAHLVYVDDGVATDEYGFPVVPKKSPGTCDVCGTWHDAEPWYCQR